MSAKQHTQLQHLHFGPGGIENSKSVTTSASLANCTGTNLAGRSYVMIDNEDASKVLYWGWNSTVTSSTGVGIQPLTTVLIDLDPMQEVNVYVISPSGTIDARIKEGKR